MVDANNSHQAFKARITPFLRLPSSITMGTKSFFLFLVIFFVAAASIADAKHSHLRKEKVTRLRVYWHDVVSGKNPTSITVTSPPSTNTSATGFGTVQMIDNPLTEKPEITSRLVGRAQGFYAAASQGDLGMLMNMNVVFVGGKYNGSTITVLGRNSVMDKVRELSIAGGTGAFRLASGYVELRTHWFDQNTGDATVQYDLVVVQP